MAIDKDRQNFIFTYQPFPIDLYLIYIYKCGCVKGDVCGIENGLSKPGSNPEQNSLCFT